MARKYFYDKSQPERVEIIAFDGAFHGRSSAGIAAAGAEKLTKGFGPLLPGFRAIAIRQITTRCMRLLTKRPQPY